MKGIRHVALLLVLLAGGCSGRPAPAAGPPPVPWDGTVPAEVRPSTVDPAVPCRAEQLRVVGAGFQFSAAVSGGTGTALLRNSGRAACQLTGRPGVAIVGAVPAPRQQQSDRPAQPPAFPTVAPPDSTLAAVPPGASVAVALDWRNWCVPRTSAKPVPPTAIRLTLPGGGHLDAGYNAVPPCDAPDQPSTLGVHPFQPAPLPDTPQWTAVPVQAQILPWPGSRLTGRRGGAARYVVRLHNPSTVPVPFTRCPLLVELLAPAGTPEVHRLNCGAAGTLPAGGTLRFEMRIRIPAGAPAGSNGLFWELDPTGAQAPEAVARLTVS